MNVVFWYRCLGCGKYFCKEMPKRELLLEEEAHDCWRERLKNAGVTNREAQLEFLEDAGIFPHIRHVAVHVREADVPEKLRRKFLGNAN